ncbi:Protein HGH1-like protein [Bienertia sinuspersici]
MATELEELLDFLCCSSPSLKKEAVNIVRGLTGSEDGMQSLAKYSELVLPKLAFLLGDPKEVSEPAAESLINLSQNTDLAGQMISIGIAKKVMGLLYKPESAIRRLLVMLLVNLTQLDAGISYLLQVEDERMQGFYVMKLVRSFCRSHDENHAETQLANLLLISEFLWPALLLPVAGNKVYNQQDTSKMPQELGNALSFERELVTDIEIRVQALEAIYLIVLQVRFENFF